MFATSTVKFIFRHIFFVTFLNFKPTQIYNKKKLYLTFLCQGSQIMVVNCIWVSCF